MTKPIYSLLLFPFLIQLSFSNEQLVEQVVNGKRFTLPKGFVIELVADAPLVERPINCDFDFQGRLYVTDSSGSNEKITEQLKKKPHRIVRLEDTDGDGKYDKSVVFADKMMFPEGAMWHDGSLYVSAPPQIWKFTDTDDDGVADKREVWFDGKTLTGCANDLHGPYLGPDGWIYWCKGAFAEQTYEHENQPKFVTRASHIFRRRPEGGPVEHVMTGGMDNPVEVVFTPGGERIFNSTFLHHPHDGKRDGLVHAIYGGVYGKQHGVLEGHARTGDLMPVLVDHDASAPSGLIRLQTDHFGKDYKNNVLCSSFNMHKIFRHRLTYNGSLLQTKNEDFVVCHDLDFHPTDIIEDADGSVLIVDTGGWYKLCCPTSQLHKPDVLGAIYRVRRKDANKVPDPYGRKINWKADDLLNKLADSRPFVKRQAQYTVAQQNRSSDLAKILASDSASEDARLQTVWTLSKDPSETARKVVRQALSDKSVIVRQAAGHVISVWKDSLALKGLCQLLLSESAANRRVAAEALGRLKNPQAISLLLDAASQLKTDPKNPAKLSDRGLEHSIIYALIQIGDAKSIAARLDANELNPIATHVAVVALHELSPSLVKKDQVLRWAYGKSSPLKSTAWRITKQNPDWGDDLVRYFRYQFKRGSARADTILPFVENNAVQTEIRKVFLADERFSSDILKFRLIDIFATAKVKNLGPDWDSVPTQLLSHKNERVLSSTIGMIQNVTRFKNGDFQTPLHRIAKDESKSAQLRLKAYAAMKSQPLQDAEIEFVRRYLSVDQSVSVRSNAIEALRRAVLSSGQALLVVDSIESTGPSEIEPLLQLLMKYKSAKLGARVVASLEKSKVASSLDILSLKKLLGGFGKETESNSAELISDLEKQNATKFARMEKVLSLVEKGDIRNGQEIFHGTKASCITCHQMGYLGGRIGPSLSNIGRIRSERDLLESLMYPNQSFVRSFEPVLIETVDGLMVSGIIKNETSSTIELVIDAQKSRVIQKADIENRKVGTKSIMPSGLDKQFTDQELADLIRFMKAEK